MAFGLGKYLRGYGVCSVAMPTLKHPEWPGRPPFSSEGIGVSSTFPRIVRDCGADRYLARVNLIYPGHRSTFTSRRST